MRNKSGFRECLFVVFILLVAVKSSSGQSGNSPAAPPPPANAAAMEFVRIAPGEFMMGCSPGDSECAAPERPARRVQITKAFEIGRYEVTQAQWRAVMGSNPSYFKGDDLPVEQVSWTDVQQFLEKLNARGDGYRYRLPTEAEWEYAARASASGAAPGGLDDIAWYSGNAGRQSHPVGKKQPNAWGLHDMLGNVSEWVQDFFDLTYYSTGPAVDPPGPATGTNRVMRGGSFAGTTQQARVSYRVQMPPSGSGHATIGFRYVRD